MNKKMGLKKYFFAYSTLVVVILFAFLVIAATGDAIKIRAPLSGTNYSAGNLTGTNPTLFNVTFLNGTVSGVDIFNGSDILNATFYVNISSTTWLILGNSTHCVTYPGVDANVSCTAYLNASALHNGTMLSDGHYTINATIFNTTTGSDILLHGAKIGNLTTIIVDSNGPLNVNKSGISSGSNQSTVGIGGNLTLNVSVADSISKISAVIFQVWNGNSLNESLTAVQEGSSQYWSASINTSHFNDGFYNITFFVNDTVGNFNVTANSTTLSPNTILTDVIFDNTAPTATVSCTPGNVNIGDEVICTCSPGDDLSGIDSSLTNNPTPSTSSSGTITHTCTFQDRAGNTGSTSTSYLVESGSSSSSSGSSSSSTTWTKTISQSDKELSEKGEISQQLSSKERVKVKISEQTHYIGVKSLTSSSATIEITSTPQEATLSVGETKKFEVTDDNFYDVSITLNSITNNKANLTILSINEEIPQDTTPANETTETQEEEIGSTEPTTESSKKRGGLALWLAVLAIIAIAAAFGWWFYYSKSSTKKRK